MDFQYVVSVRVCVWILKAVGQEEGVHKAVVAEAPHMRGVIWLYQPVNIDTDRHLLPHP